MEYSFRQSQEGSPRKSPATWPCPTPVPSGAGTFPSREDGWNRAWNRNQKAAGQLRKSPGTSTKAAARLPDWRDFPRMLKACCCNSLGSGSAGTKLSIVSARLCIISRAPSDAATSGEPADRTSSLSVSLRTEMRLAAVGEMHGATQGPGVCVNRDGVRAAAVETMSAERSEATVLSSPCRCSAESASDTVIADTQDILCEPARPA
mmetsp:Transcript_6488/g.20044  ORF Transcript_6488/g.20044 Transcript_6488/m.20044 type:complete len:206 (+) Transcript_6488:685-1302(+)